MLESDEKSNEGTEISVKEGLKKVLPINESPKKKEGDVKKLRKRRSNKPAVYNLYPINLAEVTEPWADNENTDWAIDENEFAVGIIIEKSTFLTYAPIKLSDKVTGNLKFKVFYYSPYSEGAKFLLYYRDKEGNIVEETSISKSSQLIVVEFNLDIKNIYLKLPFSSALKVEPLGENLGFVNSAWIEL